MLGDATRVRARRWAAGAAAALAVSVVVACFTLPGAMFGGALTPDSTEHLAIAHSWVHGAGFVDPVKWYYLLPGGVPQPALAVRAPAISVLAAIPLAMNATLGTVMVVHAIWAGLVGGAVFLVGSQFMRRRAAAAAALLLCISPSWIFVSNTPLTEVTATAAYLLILVTARGPLESRPKALLCAALTLIAYLTRPQLAAMALAVVAAAVIEIGPRRALRCVPLWTYGLCFVVGIIAIGAAVEASTDLPLYAGYGHQYQVLSLDWSKGVLSYGHAYDGILNFVRNNTAAITAITGQRVVQLASALCVGPFFNHVGWIALPAIAFGLARPRDGVLAHRINAFAMLGYSAVIIATYSAFDPKRYPLLVAVPACLGAGALLDAGARRLEERLRRRPGDPIARLPSLVPLLAVVAVFVVVPARSYLPRLPDAWALYRLDRSAPAPLKAETEEVLALCRSMPPDAVVASVDPWRVLVVCGNAGLRLPTDLLHPQHPDLLGRFIAEREPDYFLIPPAYPAVLLRRLLATGRFRKVTSSAGSLVLEVIDVRRENGWAWRAPPPLRCAGRPEECARRAGR